MQQKERLIRDPDVLRVGVVNKLPAACGGGVVVPEDDGTLWLLLEPPGDGTSPPACELTEWSEVCYAMLADGQMVTCADQAERFGVTLETAHAAFWEAAWEWWGRTGVAQ